MTLETALLGLLELVVIDLGTDDDAFVIFETLNARGTPLLASDLVKNFVMQTASHRGLDKDEIHARYWEDFETDGWWRQDVRQGRLTRPRIDVFLDYWLEARRAKEVLSHQVFPTFKQECETEGVGLTEIARDLKNAGNHFRSLDEFEPHSPEETFIYRWRTIDAGTSTPLLLWLLQQTEGALSRDGLLKCLSTLESFLVRRMLCRLTTKDYNHVFLDALSELKKHPPGEAAIALESYLLRQSSESRLWPPDEQFVAALSSLPLYRLLTRARLRFILEAIEDELRGPKSEDQHVTRRRLTIEHILPQAWRDQWADPTGDDPTQAAQQRDVLLHTLGNLTLVTASLNPALSNAAWSEKQIQLHEHTVLLMNKQLLASYSDAWNEASIQSRGQELADVCLGIWKHPGARADAAKA